MPPKESAPEDLVVYIVVLNWNGWADTVVCLESLLRLDYGAYRIVVCDNGSEDESMLRLEDWANGRLDGRPPHHPEVRTLVAPPVPKPIPFKSYAADDDFTQVPPEPARLVLIATGANLGFAGGNNVGIRYALSRGDADYVWILNNDSVASPRALRDLVQHASSDPKIGICGSTLLYMDRPRTIQALGGATYRRSTGQVRQLGEGSTWLDGASEDAGLEKKIDYVVGASMLVSKRFLQEVGLMGTEYFLYFEEIDWAVRGRRAPSQFRLGYARGSVVFHRQGGSTGANLYYYLYRNRLRFTWKHFPWLLPIVLARMAVTYASALIEQRVDELEAFHESWFFTRRSRKTRGTDRDRLVSDDLR